jgi:hypothetical protein
MFPWLLAQWDATSVGLMVTGGLGGVWLSIVGCVYRYQRLVEIRTILRSTPAGGRAVAFTRRGPSMAAFMVEASGSGWCSTSAVRPVQEIRSI